VDNTLIEANLAVIAKRWPHIISQMDENVAELNIELQQHTFVVNNIQLTTNYSPATEATLQSQRIAQNESSATIYGTGLGYLQRSLLARSEMSTLNVCILNFSVFYYALNLYQQTDWLSDERINLISYIDGQSIDFPFVALPGELMSADDNAARLKDNLELELAHEHFQKSHLSNDKNIIESFLKNEPFIVIDNDIKAFGASGYKYAFIAAAGPTLRQHYQYLKSINKNEVLLIALDASVKPLLDNGIVPDVVFSIDPAASFLFNDVDLSVLKNTSLVYFPRISSTFISDWSGPRYVAYSPGELYKELSKKIPKSTLFSAGSVIHPAVDFCVKSNFKDVILLGADFSFPGGKSHAHWDFWQESIDNPLHWLIDGHGNKVVTTPAFKGYMRDLERYILSCPQTRFYSGSKDSAKMEGVSFWKN